MIYYQRFKINAKEVFVVSQKSPPQIFHDKEEKPKNFVMYPIELFAAINNLLPGNEAKLLLTLLGCKGDGSFSPSTQYILNMTGISKPNHYFSTRKKLEEKKYLEIDEEGNLYINTERILKDTKTN